MRPIWTKENAKYAEFLVTFTAEEKEAVLKITACHNYAVYLNGAFLANGQYADLPNYKCVDEIPFTPLQGENTLFILASTSPEDYSTVRVMPSFVAFSCEQEGKTLFVSSESAQSRPSVRFSYGDTITGQLGMGWRYDFTAQEEAWADSCLTDIALTCAPRPIAKTKISAPRNAEVAAQGVFRYNGGVTAAEKAQTAWMSPIRFGDMANMERMQGADLRSPITFCAKDGDGIFILVDLHEICSGYPRFSITLPKACKGIFAWGEHLADLRIRTTREGRNFASDIFFKKGENIFENYIRRTGCRYMCLFLETTEVTVNSFTFREELYPFKEIERDFGDRLLNKIYEVGKRTLRLCAHEHYEDCPWREQALYGMDSRNQMLFGYSAFKEYALPRASMRLLAYSCGEDGLLSLCAPSRSIITIPAFSLYWILALCENAEVDYDKAFVQEMLPYAEKIMSIFKGRTGEYGIVRFYETRYWNFHEWCDGMDGDFIIRDHEIEPIPDGALTALALFVARKLAKLEEKEGNPQKANEYTAYAQDLLAKMENFYDEEKGLYRSYLGEREYNYHEYTQALMLCANAVPTSRIGKLVSTLMQGGEAVETTYACLPWKYDAIIRYADGGLDFVVEDICKQFGGMIFQGATTYWETAKGEADFNDAGSLCHGWSSVACYIFEKYLTDKKKGI